MEVIALCVRLLMNVLMLLVTHVEQSYPQTPDAAFRILPTRLQLFEYESVHFTCEGLKVFAGWKVQNTKKSFPICSNSTMTSTVTCTIDYAFVSDSGEYWCEGGGGERSNTVNITVTAGSVILESPVLPVMEGDTVTMSCRNKMSYPNLPADFYKDGLFINSSSTGNMTIHNVSKSDKGLYKCKISGTGESPESRLTVRGDVVILESPAFPMTERDAVSWLNDKDINFLRHYYILLWILVAVILFLQLLVMGLLYWKKQLVLIEAELNDQNMDLYAVIKKDKKRKKKDAEDAADNLSLGLGTTHITKPQTEEEPGVSSFTMTCGSDPPFSDQDPQYASIQ